MRTLKVHTLATMTLPCCTTGVHLECAHYSDHDSATVLPPLIQAGLIPRIFKYLWARMPEVAAGLLANTSSSAASMHSSTSSLVCGDTRRSLTADDGSRCTEQPNLKWLVRCSMLEIHR